ncbi:hypothetical protein OPIT5_14070 [Opitutaceae bacterium TAV5]|nr:hypothetical protein OPIT5_14070 [Opitutaceae bacterium TAV5]
MIHNHYLKIGRSAAATLLAFVMFLSSRGIAGENVVPAAIPPSGDARPPLNYNMGVATHFAHKTPWMKTWDAERHIPMIADLGVGWIRDEITWRDVEPRRGQYRISENTRKWIDIANAHGLKIIACFNNDNRENYEDRWDPVAYGRAAAWLAKELDGKIHAIEILNEPFGGYAKTFTGGKPHNWAGREPDGSVSPWIAHYAKLLNTAADAIKAANPRMTVIGLGNVMPQNYHHLEMGVSRNVDAITDHPYSFRSPPEIVPHPDNETYRKRVGFAVADASGTFASYVRMCLEKSRQHNGPSRYWITESGWTTYREGDPKKKPLYAGFSEAAQARYAQRRLVEGLAVGVEVNILYDFLDDYGRAGGGKGNPDVPGDPFDPEQNFGLVRQGDIPKPAYAAVQKVARATAGFRIGSPVRIKAFPFSDRSENKPRQWDGMEVLPALSRIMAYPFTDTEGRAVFAMWSAERVNDLNTRAADVEFAVAPGGFTVELTDLMTGEVSTPPVEDVGGRLALKRLAVPDYPILLRLIPAAASR